MKDLKKEIIQEVITAMEKGISWRSGLPDKAILFSNINKSSNKLYKGVNQLLLSLKILERGYLTNEWSTYRQIKKLGGQVKRGEKGTRICFYKNLTIDKDKDTERTIPMLRLFTVFNISQTDMEIKEVIQINNNNKIAIAESFIPKSANIKISDTDFQPHYNVTKDLISIPDIKYFDNENMYYSSLFHELGHWTGEKQRLNRDMKQQLESYSKEELIAELTSSILCSKAGIRTDDILNNQGAYLKSWISALRNDYSLLFTAASKAWEAIEYIEKINK